MKNPLDMTVEEMRQLTKAELETCIETLDDFAAKAGSHSYMFGKRLEQLREQSALTGAAEVERLRKEGAALMAHADALEAEGLEANT